MFIPVARNNFAIYASCFSNIAHEDKGIQKHKDYHETRACLFQFSFLPDLSSRFLISLATSSTDFPETGADERETEIECVPPAEK